MDVSISFFCTSGDCKKAWFWLNIPMRKAGYIEGEGASENYRIAAQRLADQELQRHAENILLRVLENRETFSAIARELLPKETEFDIVAGQMAVSLLVQKNVDLDTYQEIIKRNRAEGAKNARKSARPTGFQNLDEGEVDVGSKSRWRQEEITELLRLVNDDQFKYKNGPHHGEPCFPAISIQLNKQFALFRPARRPAAFASKIRRMAEERDFEAPSYADEISQPIPE